MAGNTIETLLKKIINLLTLHDKEIKEQLTRMEGKIDAIQEEVTIQDAANIRIPLGTPTEQ